MYDLCLKFRNDDYFWRKCRSIYFKTDGFDVLNDKSCKISDENVHHMGVNYISWHAYLSKHGASVIAHLSGHRTFIYVIVYIHKRAREYVRFTFPMTSINYIYK